MLKQERIYVALRKFLIQKGALPASAKDIPTWDNEVGYAWRGYFTEVLDLNKRTGTSYLANQAPTEETQVSALIAEFDPDSFNDWAASIEYANVIDAHEEEDDEEDGTIRFLVACDPMPVANPDVVETSVDEEPASDSSADSVVEPSSVEEDAPAVGADAGESSSEPVVEPSAEVPAATVESPLPEGPAEPEGEAPVVEVPVESAPVAEVPAESPVEPAPAVEVPVEEAALNDVVEFTAVEGDVAPTAE